MTYTPNTTQGKGAIDWDRPLIAYDTAGNTRHVHLDGAQTWAPREYRVTGIAPEKSDEPVIFYASGAHKYGTDWRIRNISEHPTPTQYAPELVERMVALLKKMAARHNGRYVEQLMYTDYTDACSIVFDLPQEVDPDLVEAEAFAYEHNHLLPRDLVLAAFRHVRQLQRGEAA